MRVRTIRVPDHLRSRVSVCCGPPWTFGDYGYGVHVLADGVSSCNKEEVPRADAPSWCTDRDGREHVVPLARCVPIGLSLAWVRSSVCHLVDESSSDFKAFVNVIKAENGCLSGIRFYKQNIYCLITWRICITYNIDK